MVKLHPRVFSRRSTGHPTTDILSRVENCEVEIEVVVALEFLSELGGAGDTGDSTTYDGDFHVRSRVGERHGF